MERSLVSGDKGSYLPNCKTNLVIALRELSLFFWHFINTTGSTWANTSLLLAVTLLNY